MKNTKFFFKEININFKPFKNIFVLLFINILVQQNASAGFVGSFDTIQNSPGYIDFNTRSPWYKGLLKLDDRKKDGIERRTPSEIIDYYFDDKFLNVDKVMLLIKEIKKKKQA